MLTVWRKSGQFTAEKGSASAWIFTIARNMRIDRVRKQAVWQRYCDEFEMVERLRPSAETTIPCDSGHRDIERALRGLPMEQLQVVQLSFIDGLSQSEIADRLKLPLGTVKSRMRLAFGKLRGAAEGEL
jgi:RNA polymerase sigma-70 factor (ECF subfamily)